MIGSALPSRLVYPCILYIIYIILNILNGILWYIQGDLKKNVTPSFQAKYFATDASYDFARYGIWKSGQFPFEWMYSHSVPLSNSVVTGCKLKVVRFLRVQISDRFRRTRTFCFVIPLSQHSLHCDLWTAHKTSRSHQSLHHLLISLEPVLKAATVAGYASI